MLWIKSGASEAYQQTKRKPCGPIGSIKFGQNKYPTWNEVI